jgi:hypothetical protein
VNPATAILLAESENKRYLLDLLTRHQGQPEATWPAGQRMLYREMITNEWRRLARGRNFWRDFDDDFEARERFAATLLGYRYEPTLLLSEGQRERSRRRVRREAVTALDGAGAVTTGRVEACIVCGRPRRPWDTRLGPGWVIPGSGRWPRRDGAYCSNACRQRAYRTRAKRPR